MDYAAIFKALPHVMRIWVTKDGQFHLHDANGGEVVERLEAEQAEPIAAVEPVVEPSTEEEGQPQGGEVVERPEKKTGGRPRKSAESNK